jgi:anti-sigma-K factor RskA
MTRPPLSENWQELVAGHVLGNLDSEEAEIFCQLMEAYPIISSEVNRLQQILALMPYALPDQSPPDRLRNAILEATQPQPSQFKRERALQVRSRWLSLTSAAAGVLLAVLGGVTYQLRQDLQRTQAIVETLQQPHSIHYALGGMGIATQASGSLVVNPARKQVYILVQHLPQLPTAQVYRLWGANPGNPQPIYCGQFNSDRNGKIVMTKTLSPTSCSAAAQMLVTIESVTAPPVPKGSLVMQSSL